MKKTYFVESVKQVDENHATALLLYIPENIDSRVNSNKDFKWYVREDIDEKLSEILQEGEYVYRINGRYQSANNDPRVIQIGMRYSELVDNLRQRQIEDRPNITFENIDTLYSYHINVGHGNHSLIVFNANGKIHIWMVDCSDYDFISHHYYRKNIDACLNHIKIKFGLPSINIETVMLTHPHYDHYSGISYYINKNIIDRKTLFYINLRYNIKHHNFNNLLSRIFTLGSRIVEPFSCNSNNNIQILYPDIQWFGQQKLSLNNMSSVYNIHFDGVSYFVFPGDLERQGWELINKNNTNACAPYMKETRYYAISHHGSINGHLRNFKCAIRKQIVRSVKDCLLPDSIPVLMGRDKAFSGIYSATVLHDFNGRILYSEKDAAQMPANFLEIDLLTSTHKWY